MDVVLCTPCMQVQSSQDAIWRAKLQYFVFSPGYDCLLYYYFAARKHFRVHGIGLRGRYSGHPKWESLKDLLRMLPIVQVFVQEGELHIGM